MRVFKLLVPFAACVAVSVLFSTSPHAANRPQNGPIVVVADTGNGAGFQIYRLDPQDPDKPLFPLTHFASNSFGGLFPNFSTDGKRVAFVGPTRSGLDVFVVEIDGSHLRQLTSTGSFTWASWSPDQSRLLIADSNVKTTGNGFFANELATIDARTGGDERFLTADLFQNNLGFYTPDGRNIVYWSDDGGVVASTAIMNTDGSDKHRLTDVSREFSPSGISPNGQRVLLVPFTDADNINSNGIWIMNIDGSNVRQLTSVGPNVNELYGTFSPDGTKIAFTSTRAGNPNRFDCWMMDADGTHLKMLRENCALPTWGRQ